MVKDRFWNPERYDESARDSARATLWESLRILLALHAPILPFVTEELYQRIYRPYEDSVSLHVSAWPEHRKDRDNEVPEMAIVGGILRAVRALRTEQRISQTRQLQAVVLDLDAAADDTASMVRSLERTLQAVGRAQEIRYEQARSESELQGVRVDIIPVVTEASP
jgi:valyl-tRNA synthetase